MINREVYWMSFRSLFVWGSGNHNNTLWSSCRFVVAVKQLLAATCCNWVASFLLVGVKECEPGLSLFFRSNPGVPEKRSHRNHRAQSIDHHELDGTKVHEALTEIAGEVLPEELVATRWSLAVHTQIALAHVILQRFLFVIFAATRADYKKRYAISELWPGEILSGFQEASSLMVHQ